MYNPCMSRFEIERVERSKFGIVERVAANKPAPA
jgi:hypothetical protein